MRKNTVFIIVVLLLSVLNINLFAKGWKKSKPRFKGYVFYENKDAIRTSIKLSSRELAILKKSSKKVKSLSYYARLNSKHWMAAVRNHGRYYLMIHDDTQKYNCRAIVHPSSGRLTILHGVDYESFSRLQDANYTAKLAREYLQVAIKNASKVFAKKKQVEIEKKSKATKKLEPTTEIATPVQLTNTVRETNIVDQGATNTLTITTNDIGEPVFFWDEEIAASEKKMIPPRRKLKLPTEVAMEIWDYLSHFPIIENAYYSLPEDVLKRGDMDSDDFALYAWLKFRDVNIEAKVLVIDFEEGKRYHTICVFKSKNGWKAIDQEKGILPTEASYWKSLPGFYYKRTVRFQNIDVENTWLKSISTVFDDSDWKVSVYFDE